MSDNRFFQSDEAIALLDASRVVEQRYVAAMAERNRQLEAEQAASREAAEALMAAARAAENRSEFELRAALSDAIEACDSALHQVVVASGNVDRAKQRCDAADLELAQWSDLDERITAFHVSQIKNGTDHDLPAALKLAEAQRGQVVDRISAAHRVHATLQTELQIAERNLAECTALRSRAAAHVISKSFDDVASQLNAVVDLADIFRRKLVSAAATWIAMADGAAPLGLSTAAREAIWRQLPDMQPDTMTVDSIRDWHTKLINDPNANEPA